MIKHRVWLRGLGTRSTTLKLNSGVNASALKTFFCNDTQVQLVDCKSWFSGARTPTSGHGFHLQSTYPGGVALLNCTAQDNKSAGFRLESGAHRTSLQGCVADSNSTRGAGSNAGLEIDSTSFSMCDVICYERKADGTNSYQQNALRIDNASAANVVRATHSAHGTATVGSAIMPSSNSLDGNDVTVNAQRGEQAVSFAASITPDPYAGEAVLVGTLTGNVTVNNPTNGHKGCRLTFLFKQDGIGGRTVTFGSAFRKNWTPSTAANKNNTITFVFDGTNWNQTAAATGL